jgi:hypothetical protein
MMSRPNPGTAAKDGVHPAASIGLEHKSTNTRLLPADQFARSAEISGTCFEHRSPIRTRCPGPAAQMSVQENDRWMPVCRRAVS